MIGSITRSSFLSFRFRLVSSAISILLAPPRISLTSRGFWVRRAVVFRSIRSMSTPTASSAGLSPSVELAQDESSQIKLLEGVNDEHRGVIVEIREPMDPEVFGSMLRASVAQWRKQGKRGVWIKVPIEHVNLVEVTVKQGFWYHHAERTYLMLVYWIPEGVDTLPSNASHRVGVGAFVMNEKREVLVVQEKSGKFRGSGIWKFPTGVVDEGEDICTAAVREVKEETAVDAEFIEVLAFRQSHKSFFEKSDLFFVCMLRPLSMEIQKQESEIEEAKWMAWDYFLAQPFVRKNELTRYMCDIGLAKKVDKYSGFSPGVITSVFSDKKSYLYYNCHDLKMQ